MANNAAPARRAVLGLDVGKASHWACMLTRDGEVAVNRPVANSEHELDRLFSQVEEGTLVVVDQVRNIGALPISRARRAGLDVAYLPGIAAHQASRMFEHADEGPPRWRGACPCAHRRLRRRPLQHLARATSAETSAIRHRTPCRWHRVRAGTGSRLSRRRWR